MGGRDKAGSFQELSINQGIKHTESLDDMHVVSFLWMVFISHMTKSDPPTKNTHGPTLMFRIGMGYGIALFGWRDIKKGR